MAKLKIMINFDFLKWFYIYVEKLLIEREGGEVLDNREYRRKKNRQLVSYLHRSQAENPSNPTEDLAVVNQYL